MKTILLFLFLCMTAFAQPTQYPLHIGDKWQYRNMVIFPPDTSIYSTKIVGDTTIDGKKYAVIIPSNFINQNLVRQSGDSIFIYRSYLKKEILYYDFSRAVGDTISSTPLVNDTMDIVLHQKNMGTLYGSLRRIWVFAINQSRRSIDDEYVVSVADSIGIISLIPDFGDPIGLTGAVINGKQYGTILGVDNAESSTPTEFILWQNYPNPFNPTTTIRFFLPQSSPVVIEVYYLIGELLMHTDYSLFSAGEHEYKFNASHLGSGSYFYRIKSLCGFKTGKMLLVK